MPNLTVVGHIEVHTMVQQPFSIVPNWWKITLVGLFATLLVYCTYNWAQYGWRLPCWDVMMISQGILWLVVIGMSFREQIRFEELGRNLASMPQAVSHADPSRSIAHLIEQRIQTLPRFWAITIAGPITLTVTTALLSPFFLYSVKPSPELDIMVNFFNDSDEYIKSFHWDQLLLPPLTLLLSALAGHRIGYLVAFGELPKAAYDDGFIFRVIESGGDHLGWKPYIRQTERHAFLLLFPVGFCIIFLAMSFSSIGETNCYNHIYDKESNITWSPEEWRFALAVSLILSLFALGFAFFAPLFRLQQILARSRTKLIERLQNGIQRDTNFNDPLLRSHTTSELISRISALHQEPLDLIRLDWLVKRVALALAIELPLAFLPSIAGSILNMVE